MVTEARDWGRRVLDPDSDSVEKKGSGVQAESGQQADHTSVGAPTNSPA